VATEVPDDSFVVRFGGKKFKAEDLMARALTHYMQTNGREFGLSVNTLPGKSPDEIATAARRPNAQYRYATAREIRAIGLDFADEIDEDGHTNVLFPNPPTPEQFRDFAEVFATVRSNPNPVPPDERKESQGEKR
jgi:hypothetical protein